MVALWFPNSGQTQSAQGQNGQARGTAPTGVGLSLPDGVRRFKIITTKRYADGVKQNA